MRSALVSSQAMCPIVEDRFSRTRLGSSDPNGPNFKEVSGLAFSPSQTYNGNPVFFAVSDGGGDARIGIFDSESGKRLRTLRVDRNFFRNADWESMTMGSCGRSGSGDNCLYIMDAGDNQARMNNGNKGRDDYAILKIREPRWTDYSDNDEIPTSRMAKMRFDYRHSSSPTNYADCESMFIDHTGWGDGEEKGDIYLVTKWDRFNERSKNRLFRLPASAWPSGYNGAEASYSLRAVGNYDYNRYEKNGSMHFMKTTWSAGEMSFDGTMIALGNLQSTYVWLRCPGTSVADALANPHANAKPCVDWKHPATGQVETIAWTPDRRYTLDIPEGDSPKMGWTKLRFDPSRSSQVCAEASRPSRSPTPPPTPQPTRNPTPRPTPGPTTAEPTGNPTPRPTEAPQAGPTPRPTKAPTPRPTQGPTTRPSESPTNSPSVSQTVSMSPTACSGNGHFFELILQTDQFGANTQWTLYDADDKVVGEGRGFGRYSTIRHSQCLEAGLHSFEISNEFVDGVPGLYQIWYDKNLMYDSQGGAGSYRKVLFGTEFDDSSVVPKTPSPTQAPTAKIDNEIFGSACGGICPGKGLRLVNEQEIVRLGRNGGIEYFCGTLDKRYQQLFSTPDACEALQVSAQEAGCRCEVVAFTGTGVDPVTSSVTGSVSMKTQESPSQSAGAQLGMILGVIAAVLALGVCYYKCTACGRRLKSAEDIEAPMDGTMIKGKGSDEESGGDTNKTVLGDDTTVSDESSELTEKDDLKPLAFQRAMTAWGSILAEKDGHQPLSLRKVKSAWGVITPKNEDDLQPSKPLPRVKSDVSLAKSDITMDEPELEQVVPLKKSKSAFSGIIAENPGLRSMIPLRKVQSSISARFLHSWNVTMPEGGTDHSENGGSDPQPFDETVDGFEVASDDKPPKESKGLGMIISESYDDSADSEPNVELNLSNISEESAIIMSA